MSLVSKSWASVVFFATILVYYIFGVAPDMTWVSLGGDAFDYVISSENMWAGRPTGYPTYIMFGWIFERLPGNAFWSLGLLSAVSTWVTCIFIFLLVRYLGGTDCDSDNSEKYFGFDFPCRRWAPYAAVLAYAASFIVWTQAVIPEVYTFTTMFMVGGTYFVLTKRYWLAVLMLALGLGTHYLIAFAIIPLMIYVYYIERDKKLLLKLCAVGCLGFLAYLQTALCVVETETGSGLATVAGSYTSLGVVMTLPISDTWSRLSEALPILLVSSGICIIPFLFLWRSKPIYLLSILAILPIVYYLFSNIPMWMTYLVPSMAFIAVLAGIGFSRFRHSEVLVLCCIAFLGMMSLNYIYYDIGSTVDVGSTSARDFYNELDTLPDHSVLYIDSYGEPWLTTYYYCVDTDYRIDFVYQGQLQFHPENYRKTLETKGFSVPEDFDKYGERISETSKNYASWDTNLFLSDFMLLNPHKEIYECSRNEYVETLTGKAFTITRIGYGFDGDFMYLNSKWISPEYQPTRQQITITGNTEEDCIVEPRSQYIYSTW